VRATVDGIEIEGTPEEIATFLAALKPHTPNPTQPLGLPNSDEPTEARQEGITEQFAYRALRRLPLSPAQKSLLQALKKAHPDWVRSSELQAVLNCSPTSLGGVFGGLGRRISATKGHIVGFNLWDWKWDDDEGEWAYRLPDAVFSALGRADL